MRRQVLPSPCLPNGREAPRRSVVPGRCVGRGAAVERHQHCARPLVRLALRPLHRGEALVVAVAPPVPSGARTRGNAYGRGSAARLRALEHGDAAMKLVALRRRERRVASTRVGASSHSHRVCKPQPLLTMTETPEDKFRNAVGKPRLAEETEPDDGRWRGDPPQDQRSGDQLRLVQSPTREHTATGLRWRMGVRGTSTLRLPERTGPGGGLWKRLAAPSSSFSRSTCKRFTRMSFGRRALARAVIRSRTQ